MANTTPYSFNIINNEVVDTISTKPYNKDGAIVFNVDSNELAINIGNIYDENTKKANRRRLNCKNSDYAKNADYAENAGNADFAVNATEANQIRVGSMIVSGSEILEMAEKIENSLSKDKDNFISGDFKDIKAGTGINTTNLSDATLITGFYNDYANATNALFIVGCGTSDTNRKNALTVYKNDTIANNNKSCLVLEGNIYSGNQTQENKLITKSELNTALANYATKSYVDNKVANVITQPYVVSAEAPTSESDKKLFWINTSKGNGVLNYWNGTAWIEMSAVYS